VTLLYLVLLALKIMARMARDVPDYKPFLLRGPFLAVLFLFVCSLTATLEYLLRTLPQEHDRNGMPHDSPYLPVQKQRVTSQQAYTHAVGRGNRVLPSGHDTRTGPVTTFPAQPAAHTIGPRRGKLLAPVPVFLTTANK